jgi:molybdopterin molybdotransferase
MNGQQAKSKLTPIDDALKVLLSSLSPIHGEEKIALLDAVGRVLAAPITAMIDVPPHGSSAMDGYAVNSADIAVVPIELPVTQRIPAGTVGTALHAGEAARIFTGAPMPAGADTVVMQENAEQLDGRVRILQCAAAGENARSAGEDIRKGAQVFAQGDRLKPQDIGVLASLGTTHVLVRRRLRVALLTTGDELIQPGAELGPGQIYNSNHHTLMTLLKALGVEVFDGGAVVDDLASTTAVLKSVADSADCIISTGGVSVGEEDHVRAAVEQLGSIDLWRLAIKPGKPFASGRVKNSVFFGLPGNPVSAFVTFVMLVRPSLLTLLGCNATTHQSYFLQAGFAAPASGNRQEYLRVVIDNASGESRLLPYANQSSGVSASLSFAAGLAIVPARTQVEPGDKLRYIPFSELLF